MKKITTVFIILVMFVSLIQADVYSLVSPNNRSTAERDTQRELKLGEEVTIEQLSTIKLFNKQNNGGGNGQKTRKYSEKQLLDASLKHYKKYEKASSIHIALHSYDTDIKDHALIQFYVVTKDKRRVSLNWYTINIYTGIGTSLDKTVDLRPFLPSLEIPADMKDPNITWIKDVLLDSKDMLGEDEHGFLYLRSDYLRAVSKEIEKVVDFGKSQGGADFWIHKQSEGLRVAKLENGKYAYVDSRGKRAFQGEFDFAFPFSDGLAVVNNNNQWYYIDRTGKKALSLNKKELYSFSDGLAPLYSENKGQTTYIDTSGREVLKVNYEAGSFHNGYAMVTSNGKIGYIDKTGKLVVPIKYTHFPYYTALNYKARVRNGIVTVSLDGEETLLVNMQGKELTKPGEDFFYIGNEWISAEMENGGILFKENEKWGYKDNYGVVKIAPKYEAPFSFSDGLAKVKINGKYGYVNKDGMVVIAPQFDIANDFSEGRAYVIQNGQASLINQKGKKITDLRDYSEVKNFSDGLAAVSQNGKWGYIDYSGKLVVPVKFERVFDFRQGKAFVYLRNYIGVLKKPKEANAKKHKDSVIAKYSTVKLKLNQNQVLEIEAYNIDNNNYFKLRDIAKLINETNQKFSVDWNSSKKLISLSSGESYRATGSELQEGDGENKEAILSASKLELDGKEVLLTAYSINGNTYYKIRDLAKTIGFEVEWEQSTSTIIIRSK